MIVASKANRELLQTEITNLNAGFGIDNTLYYNGLEIADRLLENESGEKNVILLSDGDFQGSDSEIQNTYELTRLTATDMVNRGIKIFFVQILTDYPTNYFEQLVTDIYGNTYDYYKPVKKGGGLDLKLSQEIPEIPSDGFESFVFYGRNKLKLKEKNVVYINNGFSLIVHLLFSRIFDFQGLLSVIPTLILIRKIRKIKPDIVHLHNIHGYYLNYYLLFKELKKSDPEIKVIYLTAYGTIESAIETIKLGAEDYLQKPFNNIELKHKIDRIIKEKTIKKEKIYFLKKKLVRF